MSNIPWLLAAAVAQLFAGVLTLLVGDWSDGWQWIAISALTAFAATHEAQHEQEQKMKRYLPRYHDDYDGR